MLTSIHILCLSLSIHICIYTVYMYVSKYVCMYVCMHACMHLSLSLSLSLSLYIYIYISIYIYLYLYLYLYLSLSIYIYIYMPLHVRLPRRVARPPLSLIIGWEINYPEIGYPEFCQLIEQENRDPNKALGQSIKITVYLEFLL